MAAGKKPEINLEISSGFFRIPTAEAIYNITVLGGQENSATRVVEKIVQAEKQELMGSPPPPLTLVPGEREDDFYRQISSEMYAEIGKLAKQLSVTLQDIPAEDRRLGVAKLDQADEHIENAKSQLQDIVTMTEKATMEIMDQVEKVQGEVDDMHKQLQVLKDHEALQEGGAAGATPPTAPTGAEHEATVSELQEMLENARKIISALQEESVSASPPTPAEAPEAGASLRGPFDLDAILQTVYELCTNETVKSHIVNTRQHAATIFDAAAFDRLLQDRVAALPVGADNFLEVPVSDVLGALLAGCKDEKICNLFKRMDATKGELFPVATLPLELPGLAGEPDGKGEGGADSQMPDSRYFELAKLMEGGLALVGSLEGENVGMRPATSGPGGLEPAQQRDIQGHLQSTLQCAVQISTDVGRIMELLSFQDLAGQQILKIIKLLTDFQMQLMAIVVSFGCRFKSKEQHRNLSTEESKKLVQRDVDEYVAKLATPAGKESTVLDQNAVNELLADLGF